MKTCASIIAAALSFSSLANAQGTTGAIAGRVTSESGPAVPGATVTVSNPDTGLERTTTTDAGGRFHLSLLRSSAYRVTIGGDGFQTHRATVTVPPGHTVRHDVTLHPGEASEAADASPVAAGMALSSTTTGLNVSVDELDARVPLMRDPTQATLLAPGTVPGDTYFDIHRTPGQRPISIGGASVAENLYLVNGLNITNLRTGIGSTFVPFGFVERFQVVTGGAQAEVGRFTGGVVNMVTRSGTNTLRGGISAYFAPESLQEQEPDTYSRHNSQEARQSLEINGAIGGPIFKDRLFFFGFVRYSDDDWWSMVANESPSSAYEGTATNFQLAAPYWGGKLDWNITPSHRIEGTSIDDTVELETIQYTYDRPTADVGDLSGSGTQHRGGRNYIGKYTGVFTENFLLSAQYGKNDFNRTNSARADEYPYAYDTRAGGGFVPIGQWVNWSRRSTFDEREAYRLDGDIFVGNHSIRAGLDYESNLSSDISQYSGGVYVRYSTAGNQGYDVDMEGNALDPGQQVIRIRHLDSGGGFDVESNALYVQDSWAVTPNWTANLGVRYEKLEATDGLGDPFIEMDDQWAPRVGLVWDPTGTGRAKVYCSYGRYLLPIPSSLVVNQGRAESFDENWYVFDAGLYDPSNPWNGMDPGTAWPDGFQDCGFDNAAGCANNGTVGYGISWRIISDGEIVDRRHILAANLEPWSQDELVLGLEWMVGATWSLGARYVERRLEDAIEDFTIDQGLWEQYGVECFNPDSPEFGSCAHVYRVGNPGADFEGFYDLDGDDVFDEISISADALGYPEAEREYRAVELTFARRFVDRWMLQGSYTWSRLRGNYEGWTNSDIGCCSPGTNQTFDFPALMDHAYGDLPQDRRHNLKLFGAYAFDSGLHLGGNLSYRSGRPVNSRGQHPTDPFAAQYGAFSFFTDGVPTPRGSQGTTDSIWGLDTMLRYSVSLDALTLDLRLDVFNLFDSQAVIEVNEEGELSLGVQNPNHRRPTAYQPPRTVRLGVGVSF